MHSVISGVAGSISLACWIIVFTPQLWENYSRKSAEGLSLAFVVIWLLGDLFNVVGALLQHVLPTMIVLALYYTAADIVLLWQCLVYGTNENPAEVQQQSQDDAEAQPLLPGKTQKHGVALKNTLIVLVVIVCGSFGYLLSDHSADDVPHEPQPISISGQILGWICAFLYLASRVPQIKLNYDRKSTDGVALLFFLFAAIGNITYCVSIFAADSSAHQLFINASWIVGAGGSLLLDLVIFVQFWIYWDECSAIE